MVYHTWTTPVYNILGPLLFIIYMNDLPLSVKEANITMYADDTSLSKAIRGIQDLKEQLIPAFVQVCKWLQCNKLNLNAIKTEFMMLGTHQRLHQLDYAPETTPFKLAVNDYEIRRVRKDKYLGLIVDENLTWKEHIDYICGKIKRGVGVLKRIRHFIPKDSLLLLYQTLVEPYYCYCSVVWGNCGEVLKNKLQVQQNRAARIIEKVKYENADHEKLLINLDWLSVRNILAY